MACYSLISAYTLCRYEQRPRVSKRYCDRQTRFHSEATFISCGFISLAGCVAVPRVSNGDNLYA